MRANVSSFGQRGGWKKKNATLFRHTNTRERCLRTHRVVGRRTSGSRLKIYGLGKSYTLQKTAASLIHRYAAVCNPCLWHGKICVYLNLDFNFENIRGDDATTTRADDDDAERNKKIKWDMVRVDKVISDFNGWERRWKIAINHALHTHTQYYSFSFCFVRTPPSRMSYSKK